MAKKDKAEPKRGGIRAYQRHRGLKSDNAVRKAIKAGRIKVDADGLIDFAKADKAWDANTDPAQQRPAAASEPKRDVPRGKSAAAPTRAEKTLEETVSTAASKKSDKKAAQAPVSNAAIDLARAILIAAGKEPSADGLTFVDARTAEILQKMEDRGLNMAIKAGRYINRHKTLAKVFDFARAERDAWVAWPARVAAMMAAEVHGEATALVEREGTRVIVVSAQAMELILERHVRKHLAELAVVQPKL